MFQKLPPLKSILAFESAARLGSFTLAGQELSLTQGAISYQVRQLEQYLDQALFYRRVRQVELTEAGRRLYRTTHRLLQELQDEVNLIAPQKGQLILTVAVSTYFATRWLSPRLGDFLNLYPDITVRLQHAVNDPEFMLDEVDMAIRWGQGGPSDYIAELLLAMPMLALCSPKLTQTEDPVRSLADLQKQTLLRDQAGNDYWDDWLELAGMDKNSGAGTPLIVDPNVRVQAAIDGQGLVLGNPMLRPEMDAGVLIEPFDIRLHGLGYYLVFQKEAFHSRAFHLFHDWLVEQCRQFETE